MLYVHGEHAAVVVEGDPVSSGEGFAQERHGTLSVRNGAEAAKVLVLQGVPLEEPVVQYGPFVMNTEAEIHQAFADYRRDEFGGWPWSSRSLVHPAESPRFARFGDGRVERPE